MQLKHKDISRKHASLQAKEERIVIADHDESSLDRVQSLDDIIV